MTNCHIFFSKMYVVQRLFQMSRTGADQFCQLCLILQKKLHLATSGPPEIWQDHQISRAGGPMVHCLEILISSTDNRNGWLAAAGQLSVLG